MARQNRVDPAGIIHAVAECGLLMGNRGCLHDAHGQIRLRTPPTQRWIICLTEFKTRKRALMQPGRYTELFFLDEATALSAGHRPCFECRRADAQAFSSALARAGNADRFTADAIDTILKQERSVPLDHASRKLTRAQMSSLPGGAFVSDGEHYFLVARGSLLRWAFGGYAEGDQSHSANSNRLYLMTPPSTVKALRQGYRPILHPSARPGTG